MGLTHAVFNLHISGVNDDDVVGPQLPIVTVKFNATVRPTENIVDLHVVRAKCVEKSANRLLFFWITLTLPLHFDCHHVDGIQETAEDRWIEYQKFTGLNVNLYNKRRRSNDHYVDARHWQVLAVSHFLGQLTVDAPVCCFSICHCRGKDFGCRAHTTTEVPLNGVCIFFQDSNTLKRITVYRAMHATGYQVLCYSFLKFGVTICCLMALNS